MTSAPPVLPPFTTHETRETPFERARRKKNVVQMCEAILVQLGIAPDPTYVEWSEQPTNHGIPVLRHG